MEVIDAADETADAPSASGLSGGSGHLSADDIAIPIVEPGQMQTNPSRRNLKEFVKSAEHQADHTPTMARAGCDACMRGKSQNPPQFKGSLANTDRKIEKFCDVFTCDTSYMKDTWQERGVHGKSDSMVMKDVFTGFEGFDALTNKANEETLRALKYFKGADNIQLCYSDNADPIINACIDLNVSWEPSLQGKPDTNGVAEGQVKQSLNGIRTATVQAGFPGITWPWVGPCYCFNRNTACPDGPGTSKYFKRHGVEFEGHRLAPGTGVFFKPAPTKYKLSKTLPRLQYGIFLGYRLGFGHRWRGDYMVADLDDFLELDLDQDAAPGPWGKVVLHISRKVEIPSWGIKYPLKEAYDLRNCTYNGRKDTTGVQREALVATTPPEASFPIDPEHTADDVPPHAGGNPFAPVEDAEADATVFPHKLKADILGADTPVRPSSSSKDVVMPGERLGMQPAASTPERFKLKSDARGRSYWIDEFGTRMVPSDRANGIDGSTWQAANEDLQRKWVAEHGRIWDDFQTFYKNKFPDSNKQFKERKKAASITP